MAADAMKKTQVTKLVWAAAFTGSLFWLFLIIVSPFLLNRDLFLSSLIYEFFTSICHQLPSRCFHLSGFPMPVCTRCFGIYSGFFLGTFLYPKLKGWASLSIPGIRLFAAFSLPVIIDTGGNFLFAWQTPGTIRFIIGILWGVLLPYYFIPGISEAVWMMKHRPKDKNKSKPNDAE